MTSASGGGIGVPAGRPTEDIVGRDTSKMKNDNNNNNNDEHQRRTDKRREDSGVEESVSEFDGTAEAESVRSSVVRASCKSDVVKCLVEDLSIATTKFTTTATTYDNEVYNNSDDV